MVPSRSARLGQSACWGRCVLTRGGCRGTGESDSIGVQECKVQAAKPRRRHGRAVPVVRTSAVPAT